MKTKQAQELYNSLNKSEKLTSIVNTLLSIEDFAEKYLLKNNISSEFEVGDIVCLKSNLEFDKEELSHKIFHDYMVKNRVYIVLKNNINNVDLLEYVLYYSNHEKDVYYYDDHYEFSLNRDVLVKVDHSKLYKIEYYSYFENGKQRKTPEICYSFRDPTGKFDNIKSVKLVGITKDDLIQNQINRLNQLKENK